MKRIKYYLARIKRIDYKGMWNIAGVIAKKEKRIRLFILFDMIVCSIKYKAGYNEYFEYEFYLLNGNERQTFMTMGYADQIIARYNKKEDRPKFFDKSQFNTVFANYVGRDHVDLRENTHEEIVAFLKKHTAIMAKVTDSLMGNGIERIETNTITDFDAFIQERENNRQFLLEEYFVQHTEMSRLHPKSVNTMRVITFFDGTKVHLMEAVLKIGNGSELDNFGAGGMYTVLSDEGVVLYPAFDKYANEFTNHPVTNEAIVGFQVPLFNEVLAMLDEAAREVPTVQYVGWDVAVGQTKPAIIEGNYNTGVFQMKPSLTGSKVGLMPKYRSIIEF